MALIDLKKFAIAVHEEIVEEKLDSAYPKILYLLDQDPDNFYYIYLLASYFSKRENIGAAIMAYEKAILLYPDFSECINNVGGCYRKLGYFEKAVNAFKRSIEIGKTEKFAKDCGPNAKKLLSDYVSNLGSAHVAMHMADTALGYFDEALELNPDNENAKWNQSLVLLEKGLYARGFTNYDFGDRQNAKKDRNYKIGTPTTPVWNGEKGKTVVVFGEQGIGDEIMFATIIPDLAKDCKKVIYDAHPRLYRMFRHAFGPLGVDVYGTRKDHEVAWCSSYDVDYKVPIGSLAKYYRKSIDDFPRKPYLQAEEYALKMAKDRLSQLPKKKLNIGLSWKGGTHKSSKDSRVLPMGEMVPLFNELDANFISLQYHENAMHEIDRFMEGTQLEIHHYRDLVDDYNLTLGLVQNLDLVISVPQSVIHLCGAANVRAIQLCPYRYLWQMGVYGHDMPWYSSVSNCWQEFHADWAGVIRSAITKVKGEFEC